MAAARTEPMRTGEGGGGGGGGGGGRTRRWTTRHGSGGRRVRGLRRSPRRTGERAAARRGGRGGGSSSGPRVGPRRAVGGWFRAVAQRSRRRWQRRRNALKAEELRAALYNLSRQCPSQSSRSKQWKRVGCPRSENPRPRRIDLRSGAGRLSRCGRPPSSGVESGRSDLHILLKRRSRLIRVDRLLPALLWRCAQGCGVSQISRWRSMRPLLREEEGVA